MREHTGKGKPRLVRRCRYGLCCRYTPTCRRPAVHNLFAACTRAFHHLSECRRLFPRLTD